MAKILVTGATGNTGSILVPALLEAGAEVRALVRDEAKGAKLKELGAEVVVVDMDDSSTLDEAVKGVDKIYLCTWNGPPQQQHVQNVLDAVKRGGESPHIVRHSAFGTNKSRIVKQNEAAEEMIKESGLPWTMLQPTFYMQNVMMSAQSVASDGMVYWDWADGKAGMVDVRDIADSALGVLMGEGHEGKSYILTGPESISFHDVASKLGNVLGKEVKYTSVPYEASKENMMKMGISEWIAEGYNELSEGFSENYADRTTDAVQTITGKPARSFDQFANDFKGAFEG